MPLIFYGTLAAGAKMRTNRFPFLCGVLFLLIAWTAGFRNLGDPWNNPLFRMMAVIPMACLVGWTIVDIRENGSPWFVRVVIAFLLGVLGLLGWYVLRGYFGISLPAVATFIVLAASCVIVFFLLVIFRLPRARTTK
jgi:hypothetical protein